MLLRRAGWVLFFALLVVAAVAWGITESAVSTAGFPAAATSRSAVPAAVRPLSIAEAMTGLADTPAETQLASQAASLAQSLVNDAVRQQVAEAAQSGHTHRGPRWKRLQDNRAALQNEQTALSALQARLAHASRSDRPRFEAQMQLSQAQIALDQARLADAQEDLERAEHGGTTPSGVEAQQKAAQASAEASARKWRTQWQQQAKDRNPESAHGLAALEKTWQLLRAKDKALRWSHTEAFTAAAAAQAAHDKLHATLVSEEAQNGKQMSGAMGELRKSTAGNVADTQAQQVAASAQELAAGQRRLIGYDHAAQLEGELAQVYGRWAAIGEAQEELALHDALGTLLGILAGIAVLFLLDWTLGRVVERAKAERRRRHTMRHVLRFTLEVVGVIWVLLALLGSPAQWMTFLGLTGAGLAVALQDTILSFVGWFVLIGKRGLAPGDWVEINQISGEVVEMTLLQTTIREAGNWTEPGQFTGRRVLFPNRFVFTGPYSKLATRGQWMWDEIRLPLTDGAVLPDLAALTKIVEQETKADTEKAKHEWKTEESLAPAVLVKPGQYELVDLCVRYLTTASERAERRERLYRRLYEAQAASSAR
ncbi:MAG: mechanosensitive ion channel domain-containing protein [Terriglobales bacterium]